MAFASDKGRQGAAGQGGATGYDIDNSLRFNDDDSAYLSWTPDTAGNRKTWTFSAWVKRGDLGGVNIPIFDARSSAGGITHHTLFFTSSDILRVQMWNGSSVAMELNTTQVFRDTSAWYHIVWSLDTNQATDSDRMNLYVNGEKIEDFGTTIYPTRYYDGGYINSTGEHGVAKWVYGTTYDFDGYISEVNFIDGQALDPDNFGEFDATYGHWKPIAYTGTYGTNGFYLPFNDTTIISATGGTITTDGDYKVHSFTTTGTSTFQITSIGGVGVVEYLVIAGGGGGGNQGAGGGAGGYLTATGFSVTAQSYTITVGAGGAGAVPSGAVYPAGTSGSNSVFSSITATGGGAGGGANNNTGRTGGSGGGGGMFAATAGVSTVSPNQGNDGGTGTSNASTYGGGGGGGAGAVGANGTGAAGGNGGAGTTSDIIETGINVTYAGGGGGAGRTGTPGTGGSGVGGNATTTNTAGSVGTINTGSGGGAGGWDSEPGGAGGAGGSGIVIIRYKFKG